MLTPPRLFRAHVPALPSLPVACVLCAAAWAGLGWRCAVGAVRWTWQRTAPVWAPVAEVLRR